MKKSTIGAVIVFLLLTVVDLASKIQPPSLTLPPTDQSIELYSNQTGDDLTHLYVSAIQGAKESITFVIYALTDPLIIEALNQRSKAGIPVHIVCDAKATKGAANKLLKATFIKRVCKGIAHQKILVIDQKQILLGSANMTTGSLTLHGNLVMALDHPELAEVIIKKVHSMDDEGNTALIPHTKTIANNQNIELWFLPDERQAVTRLTELIRSAQKTIKIAMFTWTHKQLTKELAEARIRGVHVETILDRQSGKGVSAGVFQLLEKGGLAPRLSTGQGLLHHKFVYIDDTILVNGSANWTFAAFNKNDDCFMILFPLNEDQQNKMNHLWTVIQNKSMRP